MESVSSSLGSASYAVMTPWTPGAHAGGAAIAIIQLMADPPADLDLALQRIGLGQVPVGSVALRDLCAIDRGLVIRWDERTVQLTPHGGAFVVRRLLESLSAAGLATTAVVASDPQKSYPESRGVVEACMLDALARAPSPMAVDVLLRQPGVWRMCSGQTDPILDRVLNRLLVPPTVVAVGRPNVGKSTLVNALARRQVAIVSPQAGTTRDHVGVTLDLDGLAVRWVDTPGIRAEGEPHDELEAAAAHLASNIIAGADLVVLCADWQHDFISPDTLGLAPGPLLVRCATRSDLGPPAGQVDVATAASRGEGLSDLARLIRRWLVPDEAANSPSPWRFHAGLP